MMKKLLLINPVGQRSGMLLSRFTMFPPLSLAYVAAVTPSNWEIKIIDENFDCIDYLNVDADIVGITAFTGNVNRAYEIASIFRKRRITVVLGGIHASMVPDEAQQYVDTVVVGEAEAIWGKVITDYENNCLLSVYYGPKIDFSSINILPRRDLLHPDYVWQAVQTSRGCPFSCNFCSVTRYLGSEYRQRNAEDVLNELNEIKSQYIVFVDDNLTGYSAKNRENAKDLFKGMIKYNLNKKWWGNTSINVADDEELLKLAGRAGCMFALVGFETFDDEILKKMKKGINLRVGVKNYKRVVRAFHKNGIAVIGAFIIGNDHESLTYYKQFADFLIKSEVDIFQITQLTPLPGTELFEQMQKEGRLIYKDFPHDWDKYRFSYMVHKSLGVETETIYTGNNYIKNRLYSFPIFQYRMLRSIVKLKKLDSIYSCYKYNKSLKKGWENSHYYKKI